MKKPILLILLCAVIALSCLAACETPHETPHKHTYSGKWSYDENQHWHTATCEHEEEIIGKSAHILVGNGCSVCDYTITTTPPTDDPNPPAPPTDSLPPTPENNSPSLSEVAGKYYFWKYGSSNKEYVKSDYHYIVLNDDGTGKEVYAFGDSETTYPLIYSLNGNKIYIDMSQSSRYRAIEEGITWADAMYIDYSYACKEELTNPFKTVGNAIYLETKDSCIVAKILDDTATSVSIPGKIDNLPVTSIGYSAFEGYGLNNSRITNITLPETITTICDYAFRYCDKLESIHLPSSIEYIGKYAFWCCEKLNYITLPNSLISIDKSAFGGCDKLLAVSIPDSVVSIAEGAIGNCDSLQEITIGSGATSIAANAFSFCGSLKSITVSPDNQVYHSDGNCIIETATKTLVLGCKTSVIPTDDSVTVIGKYAFNGSDFSTFAVPDNITNIEYGAFGNCGNLVTVTMGSGVTSIGDKAFYNCDRLKNITLNNNITHIGEEAFMACNELENITLPSSITCIEDSLFSNCYNLKSVNIPSSVTTIKRYAFYRCYSLISITIPDSVTSIGHSAFYDCSSLTNITFSKNLTTLESSLFGSCKSLTAIEIPDNIQIIEGGAFSSCSKLESVKIGSGVTRIGNTLTLDPVYAPDSIDLQNAVPSLITAEPGSCNNVFNYCDSLKSITVSPNNKVFHSKNNCVIETATKTLIVGCTGSTIPTDGSVTYIGVSAFHGNGSLTSISIPDCIIGIGYKAFYFCQNLTTVDLGNGVVVIDKYAFFWCAKLTNIKFPSSLKSIGIDAFDICEGLTDITIPTTVEDIGAGAFSFSGLESAVIDCNVIGPSAFVFCFKLQNVTIGSNVTKIEAHAFHNCRVLTDINYKGTIAQWNAIEKEADWDYGTADYTIHCSNGNIAKGE